MLCAAVVLAGCRGPGGFAHERVTVIGPGAAAAASGERVLCVAAIHPSAPLSELVASFNAEVPRGGVVLEARAPAGEGPWLVLAEWGEVGAARARATEGPGARVAVDELLVDPPAPSAEVRVVAVEAPGAWVSRLDVTATRRNAGADLRPARGRRVEIPVRFVSQATDDPALKSRLCSPSSLAMLVGHRLPGIDRARLVELCHDPRHDLFGVWPRNIQAAAAVGVPGALVRFDGWGEVRAHLERVGPIAISLTAYEGEVGNMPYDPGGGHLVVLCGLTAEGDAIVLDPAFSTEAEARRVYPARDLSRVWLQRKRGTAYALFPVGLSARSATDAAAFDRLGSP